MSNLLNLTVFLPLAGLVLCLLVPKEAAAKACRWVNVVTSALTFLATLAVWNAYSRGTPDEFGYCLTSSPTPLWIPAFGVRWNLGVDGISVALLLLTSFVSLTAAIASWNIEKSPKGYHAMFLLLLAGMLGVFMALDFFVFYVFWEVMLLPMYFLIGVWGGPRRQYAAIKFFLYTLAGSVLMLAGAILIYVHHGTFQIPEITRQAQQNGGLFAHMAAGETLRLIVFVGFFVAFAIKVPSFPFHTWLPDAHVEAPTPISMILAGVLLKMGGYGLIRMAYPFFPDAAHTMGPAIVVISLISIVYGAFVAMAQTDYKKMVAYSSVSHMGFVTLGLATVTVLGRGGDAIQAGANGAMFMMLAHGTISPMLFAIVGVIYDRAHHRDLDRFGGLAFEMPVYGVISAFAIFASLGLPGLSGFVAEIVTFLGAFQAFPTATLFALIGMVVTAAYYLITLQKVYLGQAPEVYKDRVHFPDATRREMLVLLPLAVVTLAMGLLPRLAMDVYRLDLERIVDGVHQGMKTVGQVR